MQNLYTLHTPLILASGSPRRQELLSRLGVKYDVIPANVCETVEKDKPAAEVAMALAQDKARHVSKQYPHSAVIGADTIVVHDKKILGKPVDQQDAKAMLQSLSGQWHEVITGLCVRYDGQELTEYDVTRVRFVAMSLDEIEGYIETKEPMDKAGAYGIQGAAGLYIDRIEGDYYNVMGLPLARLLKMLRMGGVLS